VTNGPTYSSEEELIKRLQIVFRDTAHSGYDLTRETNDVREVRNLAAELAERIVLEPTKWGIAGIPEELRDDAAADAFVSLLISVADYRGRLPIADWFSSTVESRFRHLWALSEQKTAERDRQNDAPRTDDAKLDGPPSEIFGEANDVWQRFEKEFPRDSFALRLRYMLKRTEDEMALMLDAPSTRAVTMRLNRAKDRFQMFCEQSGIGRRETSGIMEQFVEEPST
jgi:DNA-directed RNA polymerase specialized sigma24 family protein